MVTKVRIHLANTPQEVISWLSKLGRSKDNARLTSDSRVIESGDVFAALTVRGVDGRAFMAQALAQKASVILADAQGFSDWQTQLDWKVSQDDDIPVVIVIDQLAQQLGVIARLWFQSEKLPKVIGITGTNGKTTSCLWLSQSLEYLGQKVASIGTLGIGVGGQFIPTGYTTPDALLLQSIFADLAKAQVDTIVMEVSSHALDQGRVNAVDYETALLTNFSQDHLDYHTDLEDYWRSKAKLFVWPHLKNAVLNRQEPRSLSLLASLPKECHLWTYGIESGTNMAHEWQDVPQGHHLIASHVVYQSDGLAFDLVVMAEYDIQARFTLDLPIVGIFNLENWLAVLASCLSMGFTINACLDALKVMTAVPGRMQLVNEKTHLGQPLVVVDFAHTPDAIHKVLTAVRPQTERRGGQLWCVFGCGGNRDASKRPLMGQAAVNCADRLVITSDNPRQEDPSQIIAHIIQGVDVAKANVVIEPDRAEAIAYAIAQAQPNDVIVLAGKGHETTQEIAGRKLPFSDALIARQALENRCHLDGRDHV